jgi:hypothetical protein
MEFTFPIIREFASKELEVRADLILLPLFSHEFNVLSPLQNPRD